jgi:hypothetical protein
VLSCHLRCDLYLVPREREEAVLAALGRLEPCLPATIARWGRCAALHRAALHCI